MEPMIPAMALLAMGTILATGLVLTLLRRQQILDRPNARSSHDMPVPRGGGLAVVPMLLAAWIALKYLAPDVAMGTVWAAIWGAAGLAMLSWIDDLRGLPAAVRLTAHLIACGACAPILMAIGPVFQGLFPAWLDAVLTVLLWAGFVNFYNFMDGIDGITGVETAAIGAGAALVSALGGAFFLAPYPALALAAVSVGFLAYNWHPAKLFLGDVGSVPLGYLAGWVLLLLAAEGLWLPALILPMYYLADAGITLVRRLLSGERIWQAHKSHFYQRAHQSGRSHARVSGAIAVADAALVGWACLALSLPWIAALGAVLTVGALLLWMVR